MSILPRVGHRLPAKLVNHNVYVLAVTNIGTLPIGKTQFMVGIVKPPVIENFDYGSDTSNNCMISLKLFRTAYSRMEKMSENADNEEGSRTDNNKEDGLGR